MKQNHTEHVYFSFFNLLMIVVIESLGWIQVVELAMGRTSIITWATKYSLYSNKRARDTESFRADKVYFSGVFF